MPMLAGVGVSNHRSPKIAGEEASKVALASLNRKKPHFVFMFASVGYDQSVLLQSVRDATSKAPLSGCSGEGIIAQGVCDESNFSVVVITICSENLRFRNSIALGLKNNSEEVGKQLGQTMSKEIGDDSLGMFLFTDGLTMNFDLLMRGLENEMNLNRFLPVFGGGAGDNWQMKQTFQYCNDEVVSDGAVCTLFSGKSGLSWAVNHGSELVGGELKITSCSGNIIQEIDNKPVLDVFKEYVSQEEIEDWNKVVATMSFGFKAPGTITEHYDEILLRAPFSRDDKSISVPVEVTPGTSVWLTRRDVDKISGSVDKIISRLKSEMGSQRPGIVFHFDCAARGKLILQESKKESLLKKFQDSLGNDIPWVGFYTFGEIGPVAGTNYFHNYTAVVTAFY